MAEGLPRAGARPGRGQPPETVVVCVCTSGQRESVLPCLRSVLDQEAPVRAMVRVVLVDNSGDGAGLVVADALGSGGASLLCVEERRRGIPAARNRAIETALGLGADWIAFLDDDEIAPRSWLARLLQGARSARCDVLQGSVTAVKSLEDAVTFAQMWQPPGAAVAPRPRGMAATNNVILKSWIVAPPHGLRFDESMATGGSDGEFFMRARQAGGRIMRTVDAPVFEHRPAARTNLAHECRRAFRVGANTNYRYRKNHSGFVALVRLVLRALEKLLQGAWRLVKAAALILLSLERSIALARKSLADMCFAAGCFGPYLGFAPDRYH